MRTAINNVDFLPGLLKNQLKKIPLKIISSKSGPIAISITLIIGFNCC